MLCQALADVDVMENASLSFALLLAVHVRELMQCNCWQKAIVWPQQELNKGISPVRRRVHCIAEIVLNVLCYCPEQESTKPGPSVEHSCTDRKIRTPLRTLRQQ